MRVKPLLFLFALLMIAQMVSAQTFDYVQNPNPDLLKEFQGRSNDRIDDSSTQKTGYLYIRSFVRGYLCAQKNLGQIDQAFIDVILNSGTKNNNLCLNPQIVVQVDVNKVDWGVISNARLGDYDALGDHITVQPYKFNVWHNENRAWNYNDIVVERAVQKSTVEFFENPAPIGSAPVVSFWSRYCTNVPCPVTPGLTIVEPDPKIMPAAYEFYYAKKENVCNDEVRDALLLKSLYYQNPSRLDVSGVVPQTSTVTRNNCEEIMFPENDLKGAAYSSLSPSERTERQYRMRNLYDKAPEVFNSLYYNEDIQYHSPPFVIDRIELKCYKEGRVVQSTTFDEDGGGSLNWFRSGDFVRKSPQGTLATSAEVVLDCYIESDYYIATVVLEKSYEYRHKSPLDATWNFIDLMPSSTATNSIIYANRNNFGDSEKMVISQSGKIEARYDGNVYNSNPSSGNTTSVNSSHNPDESAVKETTPQKNVTGTSEESDCYSCIHSGPPNGTGTDAGAGSTRGGSYIGDSIDNSAIEGLRVQAIGQERLETKRNFMQGLIDIGVLILTFILTLHGLLSIILIVGVFVYLFGIPAKMRETVNEIFERARRL